MIAEFNGKISEDVKEGIFAFIFAVFFSFLKTFLREIAMAALCQWALDEVVQAQMQVVCSSGRGVGFGGGGASGGW